MGNRFIAALSSRYKHILGPPRAEQSEAAGASSDEAAKTADPSASEVRADSQPPVVERKAEVGATSSWQLVAPGYEFADGTLRAKSTRASPDSARAAANADELPSDAGSPPLLFGIRRPLALLGVGLSAGCAVALLGLRVGDSMADRQPSPVGSATASTQVPCPPAAAPAQWVANAATSSSVLPLLPAVLLPDATTELSGSPPLEDAPSGDLVPAADIAVEEPKVDAPPTKWRPKAKTNTKAKARTRIEMEARQVLVSGRAVAAVIILKRTGSKKGRARVRWKTLPGTAKPAKDYEGTSTTVQFADGQTQRTIFVPILQQPQGAEARTFSVVLERAPRGSALGSVTSTTVTILGDS